jgi:uncharacterized cupredoxin-like copper-binding protein
MSPVTETPPESVSVEEEMHQLEESEAALERRTDSLALTNVLAFLFAFFALGASIVAIVIAASDNGNGGMRQNMIGGNGGSNPSASTGGGMGGGGMMGTQAAGAVAPAGVHSVRVKLGEMWVRPQYTSVAAGKVTFLATNDGQVTHELMIERTPLKMDAPGRPNEDAAQGMIEDMAPGESGKMTVNLKPGSYVLFCNVTGHYAAGQHVRFTVTRS